MEYVVFILEKGNLSLIAAYYSVKWRNVYGICVFNSVLQSRSRLVSAAPAASFW